MPVMIARILKRVCPAPVRGSMKSCARRSILFYAMRQLRRLEPTDNLPEDLVGRLIRGWGNPAWTANVGFMQALWKSARETRGPVLECGSGLSTLILGAAAERNGFEVTSLEHSAKWAEHVRSELRRYGLARRVRVCAAPLRNYDTYWWYGPDFSQMPDHIGLVICDGPPGTTGGGRYGLLPVMRGRLSEGCVVLLDDVHRGLERAVLERWVEESLAEYTIAPSDAGSRRAHARIVLRGSAAGSREKRSQQSPEAL